MRNKYRKQKNNTSLLLFTALIAIILLILLSYPRYSHASQSRIELFESKCNELNMKFNHSEVRINKKGYISKYIKLICIGKEINTKRFISIKYLKSN